VSKLKSTYGYIMVFGLWIGLFEHIYGHKFCETVWENL